MYDTINKIRKVRTELEMKTDEPVTDEQVAEAVGINQRRFQRCMQVGIMHHLPGAWYRHA